MVRHKWQKLRIHVYICLTCGMGKVNTQQRGQWVTTYHRPDGTSQAGGHTPACEVGPKTQQYLAAYSDVIYDPVPRT